MKRSDSPPARKASTRIAAVVVVSCMLLGSRADACDLCAVYTGTTMQEMRSGLALSVAEQFTSFNTLELDDHKIRNLDGEWLQSSITQLVASYRMHPKFSVQLSMPVIDRKFRRATLTGTERGEERGVGDISLAAKFGLARAAYSRGVFNWDVLIGVKLPTGDTDRLGEETVDVEDTEGDEGGAQTLGGHGTRPRHDGPGGDISGVHGHDLTLGTGSVDLVFGSNVFASWRRAFLSTGVQYVVRSEGDFDYTYADDLQFFFAPGVYALLHHKYTLGLQAKLSGESKGKDEQKGITIDDTQITALELGPNVSFTYLDRASGELGFSLPLFQNTTDLQIVPDYRIRAALTWHF